MKILMLTPYLPFPIMSGGQIRTYNLLKKLATKHQITLVSLIKEDYERQYIPELLKYCQRVEVFKRSRKPFTLVNALKTAISSYPFLVIRNHSAAAEHAIKQMLNDEDFDLIHAETFYTVPHLPKATVPTLLVEQTIEYLGYESYAAKTPALIRPLLKIDIAKIKHWEHRYWNSCSKLVVMSQDDQRLVSKTVPKSKVDVVSNGVDVKWFQDKNKNLPTEPTILSVGTFNWLPNVEATKFLIEKVWPIIKSKLPQARLWIVGNNPSPEIISFDTKDPQITITGGIPDIRDAFNEAHLLMAPVFSGKGTRYKILEAMASKTPIVATPTAVEGLGVEEGKHVLTSQSAEGLAEQALKVLSDSKLQKNMTESGFKFVSDNFDWQQIAAKLDSIYQELGSE